MLSGEHMIRKLLFASFCFIALASITDSAHADDMVLMETPVKVTATLHSLIDGSTEARVAVHNGPVAQLVSTTLSGINSTNATNLLRKQISWHEPYLLVHSACNINSVRRCGGDVVFKLTDSKVIRLGDFVASENPTFTNNRFYDSYDKLDERVSFTIVMKDIDDALQVDPALTWSANTSVWKIRAAHIASTQPARDWSDLEWEKYFDAVLNNAALARYCNRSDELQSLLDTVNPVLDADHRRTLADELSKVIPLEKPKGWRKAY